MKAKRRRINYRRVSTEYQFTESQGLMCDRFMAQSQADWETIEEKVSGSKMTGAKLMAIKAAVEKGEVEEILVYALDRLGRNTLEGLNFVKLCLRQNTKITSICEPFDFSTPEGMLFLTNALATAEFYLGKLQRNTKLGLERARRTCRHCGKFYKEGTTPDCQCWEPRFKGGSGKSQDWMSAKTKRKLPDILRYLRKQLAHRDIAKLVGCDERTVRRISQRLHNLPEVRERVWDKLG